jgi:4-amino-4-deoxy-L-arabinose transferase-like glycosyltransferase
VGIACYFAARQAQKIWNPLSTSVFLLLIFFFIRRYTGKIMTENLGLTLGLLGFAFFINGVMRKDKVILSISVLLLTLGLNVRAGPFFILIGFFIAAILLFKQGRKWDKRFALILILVIILGFLINYAVFHIIGSKSGLPFSNFSYSLYGLVNNGGGWLKIFADHPEIASLPDAELGIRSYQLAFESFKTNPFGIVIGTLKEYRILFNFVNSNLSIYSYVSGENSLIYHLTQIFIYIFALIGLVTIIKKREQPFNSFLLLILVGFFLSIPFSPPSDSSNMRVFAVAIPFIAALPVVGVEQVTKKIFWLANHKESKNGIGYPKSELIVTSLLMVASIIAPIIVHSFSHPFNPGPIQCNAGQDLIYMDLRQGTSVKIFPNSEISIEWMPNFRKGDYDLNLHGLSALSVIQEFGILTPPVLITSGINLVDNQDLFLIIQDRSKFDLLGTYAICGKWSDAPQFSNYSRLFYAETFTYA